MARTGRLTWCILITALIFALSPSRTSAEKTPEFEKLLKWYQSTFSFIEMEDTVYTFESEYIFPEGFHRVDSVRLGQYAWWVSHFPLWHAWKPVGMWRGMRIYSAEEISRAVHLPWHGPTFSQDKIPYRILAEYLRQNQREFDLEILPKNGDPISYEKWLEGKPAISADGAVVFKPSEKRDTSAAEYYTMLQFCSKQSNYAALVRNCDSIDAKDVLPGDLLVAHSETGKSGRVYVVLNMLENGDRLRLYAVATGCDQACDFYIPLVNEDRGNPWLSIEDVRALAGDLPYRGFFRFRSVTEEGLSQ